MHRISVTPCDKDEGNYRVMVLMYISTMWAALQPSVSVAVVLKKTHMAVVLPACVFFIFSRTASTLRTSYAADCCPHAFF